MKSTRLAALTALVLAHLRSKGLLLPVRGDAGPIGPKGDRGEPGLSIKGDKGDKGDRGEPGLSIKGDKGDKGDRGEPGPSIKGDKGDKGDRGEPGPSIKGDKGDKGEPGLVWRGPYRFGLMYQKDDAVEYGGTSWIARRRTDDVPGGSTAWDILAARGVDGVSQAGGPGGEFQPLSEKGQPDGYASLDGGGTVPDSQIPAAIARDAEVTAAIATHEASGSHALATGSTPGFMPAGDKVKIDQLSVTQPVDLDLIEARVNDLDAAVVLRGSWDASAGTFPGGGAAQAGDSYIVSVGGTVDGIAFTANDRIVAITDNASTTVYASNWLKLDYTDQVLSVAGKTGAVVLVIADVASLQAELDAKVIVAGQIGGAPSSPDVRGLRETGGPTLLTMGAVADGEYLRRSGANIVGGPGGSGSFSATTIERDLGSVPTWRGKFTIADAAITPSSKVLVFQAPGPYTGKGTLADEAEMDTVTCVAVPGSGQATVTWETAPRVGYATDVMETGRTFVSTPYGDNPQFVRRAVRIGKVRGNMKFTYVVG